MNFPIFSTLLILSLTKLSPAEAKMLADLEKKVSQKIHAERHDTDGNQKKSKPAY